MIDDILASLQLSDSNLLTLTPEQYAEIREYQALQATMRDIYNARPVEERWLCDTAMAWATAHGMVVDYIDMKSGAISVSRCINFPELQAWDEKENSA